jgi:hypothetical protein
MSNITPGHVKAFQMIQSQLYDNVTLMSCTINGDPSVAVVMMEHVGEGKIGVMPLFVAITPSMKLSFPEMEDGTDAALDPRRPSEAFKGRTSTGRLHQR